MQNYFHTILENSLSMSLLILIFWLLQPRLQHRYTAKWLYYAWAIILFGLLLPFNIQVDLPRILPDDILIPSLTRMPEVVSNTTAVVISSVESRGSLPIINWQWAACLVWLSGVILVFLFQVTRHFFFIRMVNRWCETETGALIRDIFRKTCDDMGIKKHIDVRICSCVWSPMMVGIVHPVILLPSSSYSAGELAFIIRHELVHYQRKDLWYKTLTLLVAALHWFNPFIYLMAKTIDRLCELSCDAEVIKGRNGKERQQYVFTILKVMQRASTPHTIFSTCFYQGKKDMKNRIISILQPVTKKPGIFILCLVLISTVAAGLWLNRAQKMHERPVFTSNSGAVSLLLEQSNKNQGERLDIAQQYAMYADDGLLYDEKSDTFTYDGKAVRFFLDELNDGTIQNSFTRPDGDIDLLTIRNSQDELLGFTTTSQEEYDRRTESMRRAQAIVEEIGQVDESDAADLLSFSSEGINVLQTYKTDGVTHAFSLGDPNYIDDSLNAYLEYGVSYDSSGKRWVYGNRSIHYLSDADRLTYVDNHEDVVATGISLEVVRNASGQIEKLVEINE